MLLIECRPLDGLGLSTRPLNGDAPHARHLAQAEVRDRLLLAEIARAGVNHLELLMAERIGASESHNSAARRSAVLCEWQHPQVIVICGVERVEERDGLSGALAMGDHKLKDSVA